MKPSDHIVMRVVNRWVDWPIPMRKRLVKSYRVKSVLMRFATGFDRVLISRLPILTSLFDVQTSTSVCRATSWRWSGSDVEIPVDVQREQKTKPHDKNECLRGLTVMLPAPLYWTHAHARCSAVVRIPRVGSGRSGYSSNNSSSTPYCPSCAGSVVRSGTRVVL